MTSGKFATCSLAVLVLRHSGDRRDGDNPRPALQVGKPDHVLLLLDLFQDELCGRVVDLSVLRDALDV